MNVRFAKFLAAALAATVFLASCGGGGVTGDADFLCVANGEKTLYYGSEKKDVDALFAGDAADGGAKNGEDESDMIPFGNGFAAPYGQSIVLYDRDDKAVFCYIMEESWRLQNGVGVGSSREELYKAFGDGQDFAREIQYRVDTQSRRNEEMGGTDVELPELDAENVKGMLDALSYIDVTYQMGEDGGLTPIARLEAPANPGDGSAIEGYYHMYFELDGDNVIAFGVGGLGGYYLMAG